MAKLIKRIFLSVALLPAVNPLLFASEWGVPQILGPNVNSSAYDYMPYITADGKALYFVTDRNILTDDDIYVSHWDSLIGDWGPAIRLNSNINTAERDMFPSLTPDGKRLYFVRWGWPGGYGQYDVWYSDWDTTINDWGVAQNAGPNINTSCMEWSAQISRDGKKLYFSSGYREWYTNCEFQGLYVSAWDSTSGDWGSSVWLGDIVNAGLENHEPSPGGDETTLYFDGSAAIDSNFQGIYDIGVAYFNGTSWYRVNNPGAPLNSAELDRTPCISADGQRLFLASRRDDSTYLTIYDNIFVAERATAVKEREGGVIKPNSFDLTIYPNPFNAQTKISYTLGRTSEIRLSIYNILGQRVAVLDEGQMGPGVHSLTWAGMDSSGAKVASGVYFCLLKTETFRESKKVVFLK